MQKVRRWWPRDCGTRTDLVAGLISEKHPHCSRQAGGRASELLFVSFSWAQRSHTAETSANEEGVRGERTPQSQTLTPKPSWTQMCRWSEPCHIWTSQGPCGLYLSGSNELSLPWQLCPMPGPRSYVNTIISTLNCQAGYWETWVYRGHCTRKFLSPFSSAQFPVQVWPCPCVSESMACSAQCIPEPDYSKRTQEKSRQFSHFKQFDPFSLKSLSKQKLFFFLAPVTSVWCWKKKPSALLYLVKDEQEDFSTSEEETACLHSFSDWRMSTDTIQAVGSLRQEGNHKQSLSDWQWRRVLNHNQIRITIRFSSVGALKTFNT